MDEDFRTQLHEVRQDRWSLDAETWKKKICPGILLKKTPWKQMEFVGTLCARISQQAFLTSCLPLREVSLVVPSDYYILAIFSFNSTGSYMEDDFLADSA